MTGRSIEWYAGPLCDVAEIRNDRRGNGMPVYTPLGLCPPLGVPGTTTPGVLGAGLAERKTRTHSSIRCLNSSESMKPSIRSAPKK